MEYYIHIYRRRRQEKKNKIVKRVDALTEHRKCITIELRPRVFFHRTFAALHPFTISLKNNTLNASIKVGFVPIFTSLFWPGMCECVVGQFENLVCGI